MDQTLTEIYNRLLARYGRQHWWPAETDFEVILGAVLTQNTAWKNVEKVLAELRRCGLLSWEALSRLRIEELAPYLRSSGYFNQKARRLRAFFDYLETRYAGSLAKMALQETEVLRQELLALKGFGPETVDTILLYAFGRPIFVVDAYTRRVLIRHRLCPETISYDELQCRIQTAIPTQASYYNEFHALIVVVGKEYCRSQPRCSGCPLEPMFALRIK